MLAWSCRTALNLVAEWCAGGKPPARPTPCLQAVSSGSRIYFDFLLCAGRYLDMPAEWCAGGEPRFWQPPAPQQPTCTAGACCASNSVAGTFHKVRAPNNLYNRIAKPCVVYLLHHEPSASAAGSGSATDTVHKASACAGPSDSYPACRPCVAGARCRGDCGAAASHGDGLQHGGDRPGKA